MEVRTKMSDVKVAFLTDSCSDIPQELTDKYGIDVIGFHIMLDGKEYLESTNSARWCWTVRTSATSCMR